MSDQATPETFDGYELKRKLGEGGFGTVFEAYDPNGKRVALKILHERLVSDDTVVRRFFQEALILARLQHPAIPQVYHFGPHDNTHYLVLEFVDGQEIETMLKDGALEPDEVVGLMAQLFDALSYAHNHEIIHRDLKPANLIITPEGKLKILDFGIAKIIGGVQLTAPGIVNVTLGYASPEQLRGQTLDPRADIFAAGMLMHQMLTGKLPFPLNHKDPLEAYQAQLLWTGAERKSMREKYPQIPAWLDDFYRKCTAASATDRHADAQEARKALLAHGQGTDLKARINRGPRRVPTLDQIAQAPATEAYDNTNAPTAALNIHSAAPTAAIDTNPPPAGPTQPQAAVSPKKKGPLKMMIAVGLLLLALSAVAVIIFLKFGN